MRRVTEDTLGDEMRRTPLALILVMILLPGIGIADRTAAQRVTPAVYTAYLPFVVAGESAVAPMVEPAPDTMPAPDGAQAPDTMPAPDGAQASEQVVAGAMPEWVSIPAGADVAAFFISRTEVTNAQYAACVAAGACTAPADTTRYADPAYAAHPVAWVTRDQARAYAAWLGGRLPTGAQWLRACQGDAGRPFPWGDAAADRTRANVGEPADARDTVAVGSYPAGASPEGVLDLIGNVWEWTDDGDFVLRGGAYDSLNPWVDGAACTTGVAWSDLSSNKVGIRVVMADPRIDPATPTDPATPADPPVVGAMPEWASIPAGADVAAFFISRTEVTNAQYAACVAAGACTAPADTTRYADPAYAAHPVVSVTRDQARAYAAWLGGRLPTETQWLRACQGDDDRSVPWGGDAGDRTRANIADASGASGTGDTTPVGSYPSGASPYGVLDLAGNVWEWTDDGSFVLRGGAYDPWSYWYGGAACTARAEWADLSAGNVGFRVVVADATVSIDPPPADPTPTDVPVVDPTPTDAPVADPAPTDAPVADPAPTDAPLLDPTPTDAPVVDPAPTDAPVADPAPTDAPPADPTPTDAPVTDGASDQASASE
ncbi:MAG: SUMF1/EgtB/PvdO family nonheme iron enzyme [Chloroflexi bacterium]|nr:SUMF1/EgtB/PvdO family nonheme iron enzyme [Chloroflexota bacterium]